MIAPDGQRVAACALQFLNVWNLDGSGRPSRFDAGLGRLNSLDFSPDGSLLVAVGAKDEIGVWNAETLELIERRHCQCARSRWVCYSPDGLRFVAAASAGWGNSHPVTVHTVDSAGGTDYLRASAPVSGLAGAPDSRRFALACANGYLQVWDCDERRFVQEIRVSDGNLIAAAWSPSGNAVAVALADRSRILIIEAQSGKIRSQEFLGHREIIFALAYSPDGRRLFSVTTSSLRVWDAESGREVFRPTEAWQGPAPCPPRVEGRSDPGGWWGLGQGHGLGPAGVSLTLPMSLEPQRHSREFKLVAEAALLVSPSGRSRRIQRFVGRALAAASNSRITTLSRAASTWTATLGVSARVPVARL